MPKTPVITAFSLPIQENALSISFLQPGQSDSLKDGRVDTKTVPYAIIVQPLSGFYTVTCCGKTVTAKHGETILVPADTEVTFIHHGSKGGPMIVQWVHINWTILGTITFTSLFEIPLKVGGAASRKLGAIISRFLELKDRPDDSSLYWLADRNELGFALLKLVLEHSQQKENLGDCIARTQRLQPVFEHMKSHLQENLSVDTLAKVACLSPSRFFALFQEQMSISPMAHVRKVRITEACKLLLSTDQSISRIATETGFVSQFHFSRIFKQSMGLSPSEYRKGRF